MEGTILTIFYFCNYNIECEVCMSIFLIALSVLMVAGGLSAIIYSVMLYRKMKNDKKNDSENIYQINK